MWLRLEDNQTGFLTELLQRELQEQKHTDDEGRAKVQEIFDKLNELPDPDAQKFINAVDTSDDLEIDGDAVISRGEDGAFVMGWVYVSNHQAGIEINDDDEN